MWTFLYRGRCAVATLYLAAMVGGSTRTSAQGLAGAAIEGSVVTADGGPVRGAIVSLTESETGSRRVGTTSDRGTYLFENVAVGSYRMEARAIGKLPASREGIVLQLGDRVRVRLVLNSDAAQELGEITVKGSAIRDAGAGGPAHSVPGEAIRNLPLLNRNFVDLFAMSPQALGPGSLWVSGQHSRFNAIQIDGATGNDLFGVNVSAGSGSGGRSISLEALREIRILVAPFDVRQGGFSGGLINAVTRSGSNSFHGAAFSSYSRSELVGPDTSGAGVATFDQVQFGMSVGGPLVRDRLHYFAVFEGQSRTTQFAGPSVDEPATGVGEATALRAAQIFRDRFGFDPGGPEPPDLSQPDGNALLKLSWQPSRNHSVELTQSALRARSEGLNRVSRDLSNVDGWQLSNSGSISRTSSSSTRLKAISAFGNLTNEALISASAVDLSMDSRNRVPLFTVQADLANHYLAAGSTKSAQGTRTTQRVFEFTDNISLKSGAHHLTLGTQNIRLHIRDNFFLGSWGVWSFSSVDALERGEASFYEVALPLTDRGPLADYSSTLLSAYVQDHWRPHDRVSMTVGIRVDAPYIDAPRTNATLASNRNLGFIDTGMFPSGNAVLAPRVGFAWELGRDRRSLLRGGIGAFTGRPPMVWLTGAFSNTGQEQTLLTCKRSDGVPAPISDITRLPTRCLNAAAPPSVPSVNYFDPGYRFQQAVKYAIGLDRDFGRSLQASIDVIHTRSRNTTVVRDVNLVNLGMNAEGRTMYGSIASNGVASPARIENAEFGPVYRYSNVSADRSTSVAVSAQRRWSSGGLVQIGYDWSRTLDVMSMTGAISTVILRNNPVDGTLSERLLRRSGRDIPHNFVATTIFPAGWGLTASSFLRVRSGTPYAFTVAGDANADGTARNDLAYIPRNAGDLSLANPALYPALDQFIESQECLRRQRGRIMARNTCRNLPVYSFDGRIARKFTARGSRGLEISADLFNIPNMLNRHWGLVRETTSREDVVLLPVRSWDSAMNRPRYAIPAPANGQPVLPSIDRVVPDASRWRIQLGMRYDF